MASNIDTNNIDDTYPVAGQDNDSQGFRDNFQNIKTALGVAKSEITTLQNNTPDLTANNDFNGGEISNAVLVDTSQKTAVNFIDGTDDTIDYSGGSYQRVTLNQDLPEVNSINFSNFGPNDTLSHIRLEVTSPGSSGNRDFEINIGGSPIFIKQTRPDDENSALEFPIRLANDDDSRYIFDCWAWSTSGGVPSQLFVEYVGKYTRPAS
jgi:hypothetical protein